jgi:predicted RND superfamily exporter protein
VLGVVDGVHLTGHLRTDQNDVAQTVTQIGPACALTALTTAAAFASIMFTGNAQLFEFAVLGALGSILAFAVTITLFALLARVIPVSRVPSPQLASGFAQLLCGWGVRFPKRVILICAVLLALAILGYSQAKPWFPMSQNLPGGSATVAANDAIAADFGGVFRMIVEVDADWAKTKALAAALAGIAGEGAVLSEVNIARWFGTPDQRPSSQQLGIFPSALTAQLRREPSVQRFFVVMPEPMRDAAALARFDALYTVAQRAGADRILGLPTVMRLEAVDLISQLSRGLVIAALGATLLVALALRSLRLFPVLLAPNVLPLILTGASLHLWTRGELTPTAVLALTIAFGIAIDDTVHFLSRYIDARKQGQTAPQSVKSATRSAGHVMVLTTVLLSIGLCVTFISDFAPIRLFGVMLIVTLWAALLIDLVLLPALLSGKNRYHENA